MEFTDISTTLAIGIVAMAIQFIFNITIFYLIFSTIIKTIKRVANHKYFKNNVIINDCLNLPEDKYTDITQKQLSMFNTDDLQAFKNHFYKIFIDFENAYNNLDYNTMKALTTKQVFQNYYTGITLDLEVGKKRIINNIQKKNVIIYEVFSSTAKQVVSAMIEISYINYTIDKYGTIIVGNKDKKITEKFEVDFRKDFGLEEITNCPNCGAVINGHKCEFCHSTIKNSQFKISSIKRVIDKK